MSNSSEKLSIAIIILNYKTSDVTIECVERLIEIGVNHQIIVVDNYSPTSDFKNLLDKFQIVPNVKVVLTPKNGGYSYGNNFGVEIADKIGEFQYYCIMNPDVIISKDYFEDLCEQLAKYKEYAIIAPLMIYPGQLDLTKISFALRTSKEIYKHHFLLNMQADKMFKVKYKYVGNGLIETETVPGSCFVIDAKVFHQIGLLDSNSFLYNEESMLGIKLKRIGKKCLINLSVNFVHNHIYEKKPDVVWENYKKNFTSILCDYKITYASRKYLCEAYYNAQYIGRLKVVNVLNILLLYLKHFIAILFY